MAILANEPRDLLLDANNDLVITGGDFQFARGITAVTQSCRISVQMYEGEWFLNLDAGIPYLDGILGKPAGMVELVAKKEYRDELLAVEGVLKITKLDTSFDPITRTLDVDWAVQSELGDTPVDSLKVNAKGSV